jgi:hypothetical protein
MLVLVTSSVLFSAIQLAVNVRNFRFNRVNGERLYRTGFARPCADGLQQGIEVRLPSFERVRPTGAVLYRLVHYVRPCVVLDCSYLRTVAAPAGCRAGLSPARCIGKSGL